MNLTHVEAVARGEFGNRDLWPLGEGFVVLDPIADVWFEGVELAVDELADARRPVDWGGHRCPGS